MQVNSCQCSPFSLLLCLKPDSVFPRHLLPNQITTNQKQGICLLYDPGKISINFLFPLHSGSNRKRNLHTPPFWVPALRASVLSAACHQHEDGTTPIMHVTHLNPAERVTSETELIFKPTGKWTGCLTRRRNTQIKPCCILKIVNAKLDMHRPTLIK